jgi:hypothetical protein
MANDTDLFLYLEYLKYYFFGDLEEFHALCKSAEEKEREYIQNKGSIEPVTGSYVPSKEQEFYLSQTFDPSTPRFFRSTIPHTLAMFSVIDIIGFLLRNGKDYGATGENIKAFFTGILNENEISIIVHLYRHGMSHGYFPKLGLGLSYHSSNPTTLFFKTKNRVTHLNVNYLETLVCNKVNDVYKNPLSHNPRISEQYEILIDSYETKTKSYFEKLETLVTQ